MKRNFSDFKKTISQLEKIEDIMYEQVCDVVRKHKNFIDLRPKDGNHIGMYCTCYDNDSISNLILAIEFVEDRGLFVMIDKDNCIDFDNMPQDEFESYRDEDEFWCSLTFHEGEIDNFEVLKELMYGLFEYV